MSIIKAFLRITAPVIALLLTVDKASFAQVSFTAKNTATAKGTAPGGVSVTDISNDGLTINRLLSNQTPVNFPVIGISKTATVSDVKADGSYNVVYTITIKNFGTVALQNVQVSDVMTNTFPSPLTYAFNSVPAKIGTISLAGTYDGTAAKADLLTAASSTLAIGASATITLDLNVKLNGAPGGTTYNNTARATAATSDNTPVFDNSNNSTNPDGDGDGSPLDDNIPTPVILNTRDIAVTKAVDNPNPTVGTNVSFTITVKNNGPAVAEGVEVSDLLPAGYTFISASPSAGTYDPATGKWNVGTLANSSAHTLSISAKVVHAKTASEYLNTASSNLPADSNPVNNSASAGTTPQQLPPVPVSDSKTGNTLGTDVTLNILLNDKLSGGGAATSSNSTIDIDITSPGTQTSFTKTGEGEWTYNSSTGEVTFNPNPGYTIDPTPLTYALTETATGLSANATVTVTYIPNNPVADDDSSTGNTPGTNATVNLLTNDKLGDNTGALPALVGVDLDLIAPGIQSSLTVASEGVWSYNSTSGEVTFDPNPGFTKSPTSIPYRLTETVSGRSDDATITVTYLPLPPTAANDSSLGNTPGANVTQNILTNDKLSDGSAALPALVTVDLDPSTPAVDVTKTVAGEGVWTYDPATGNLTFDPNAGFTTDPTVLPYKLTETITGLSASANVTVTYTEVPPLAANDSSLGNTPGANVTQNILTNDKLSDGSAALPALVTVDLDPSTPAVDVTKTVAGEGVWTYDPATGNLTFDPNAGFTTDPTVLPYKLTETITGLSASANVTVTYTEVPPLAANDSSLGNTPGANVTQNILTNDKLSDGSAALPALVTVDLDPSTPAVDVTKTVAGEGVWTYDPATGNLTFDPNAGFTTDPTVLPYKLTETITGLSASANVTVTYTEVPPLAANDSSLGNTPGANVTQNILTNDKLSDGSAALPALVTVDLDPSTPAVDVTKTVAGEGVWTYDPATGNLTFDPNAGFTTDPTVLPYKLTETITGLSASANVTVTYTEVPPLAANDSSLGNTPGANVTQNILTNDKLSDGSAALPALVTVDLDPSTPAVDVTKTVAGEGVWTYDPATGNLTFDPNAGFTTDPTVLPYKLTETITGLSASANVTVTYTEVPPLAANDSSLGNTPGANVTQNILTNDKLSDGSAALPALVTVDLDPSTPAVDVTKTVAGEGVWTYDPATGNLTFDPNAGFTTDPTVLPYKLTETITGLSASANVTVTYTEVPPLAANDSSLGNTPGANVTQNILTNDKLSDGSAALPALVTVDLDLSTPAVDVTKTVAGEGVWTYDPATGNLTFDPNAGFTTDPTVLPYKLTETITGLSASANVTVTYTEVPPLAANDSSLGNTPGANVTQNILTNDKLSDGSAALPALVTVDLDPSTPAVDVTKTVAGEGVWTYDPATGNLTFDPNAGFTTDPTVLPYKLTETITGLSASANVTVTYTEVPPLAANDSSLGNTPGANVTQNILTNDKLSDGSAALPALVTVDLDPSTPAVDVTKTVAGEGVWTYDPATGNLTFDPNAGFTTDPTVLPYKLTETITGLSASANVTVTYTEVPPLAANDSSLGNTPGANVTQNILTNDKLSDGSAALPALVTVDLDLSTPAVDVTKTVAGEGVWTYDPATGNLTFDPNAGFTTDPTVLPYKLTETITGLSASANVTVTYTEVPPLAANDSSLGNTPGANVTQNILTNDKLSDGSAALPALVTVDLDPSTPAVDVTKTVAGEGVWTYDPATGNLTFDPNAGFTTDPTVLPYKLTETITGLSASANVTVTYTELPPDAVNDIGTSTAPGINIVNILTNDKLSDGSPALPDKVIVDLDPSTPGIQTSKTVTGEGTWTYNPATGNTTFVPVFGFITDPTPIPYTLTEVITGLSDNATISFNAAVILAPGIAKTVSAPKLENNGSYTFTYTMTVKNYGNVDLENVKVTDNLRAVFPLPMGITVNAVSASGTLKGNIGYNGINNIDLLTAGSTLPVGAKETITLTVNVMPNGTSGVFENTATVTGTGKGVGGTASDSSNDGLNPDPNGNNRPSESSEAVPTPVNLDPTNVVIPEGFSPNGDGTNDKFELENVGPRRVSLEVYNRWGNIVYKNPDYKNDWDGTCNTGIYVGQNVPDGTYYYVAIIDGKERRVRFITINR